MILLLAAILPRLLFDQTPPPPELSKVPIAVTSKVAAQWTAPSGAKVDVVDESKLRKLSLPRVQYRANVASATSSPWIDANGWNILRHPEAQYVYDAPGNAAARAAAEAFVYGANAVIRTDAAGRSPFEQMLAFLQTLPVLDLPAVANIGVTDDGSDETGELMNLLSRRNLLYRIVAKADPALPINVKLGTAKYPKEAAGDPHTLAHDIRYELTDDRRSLRIYGSEVVIGRLTAKGERARVHLLNYADRGVRGVRVRVLGSYSKGEFKAFGLPGAALQDFSHDAESTEFTIPELNSYAVIDLSR